MRRPLPVRALALLSATLLSPACTSSSGPPPRQLVTVARPVGSWQGKGNKSVGIVSESGRFRIRWEARDENPRNSGTFRLTVRSGVSGRAIQVVADHRGEGSGSTDFEDDPRIYDFTVDSANVNWAFTVEELVMVYADESSSSSPRNH